MALIRSIKRQDLDRDTKHSEAACTYTIVSDGHGNRCLQVDTYGSDERQEKGKKSQSMRFSPEAIQELKSILADL